MFFKNVTGKVEILFHLLSGPFINNCRFVIFFEFETYICGIYFYRRFVFLWTELGLQSGSFKSKETDSD